MVHYCFHYCYAQPLRLAFPAPCYLTPTAKICCEMQLLGKKDDTHSLWNRSTRNFSETKCPLCTREVVIFYCSKQVVNYSTTGATSLLLAIIFSCGRRCQDNHRSFPSSSEEDVVKAHIVIHSDHLITQVWLLEMWCGGSNFLSYSWMLIHSVIIWRGQFSDRLQVIWEQRFS